MHIIMGATGRVGSAVMAQLLEKKQPVKGITRNKDKAIALKEKGAAAAIADAKNVESLVEAFKNGSTLFAITPETGQEKDVIKESRLLLDNYSTAVKQSAIRKIVGVSSMGAQHEKGTGNLQVSYMLEHAFYDLPVKQVFIRPAYYFSNWMLHFPIAKESGVLPSFFPADFSMPMVSPADVGTFAAEVLLSDDIENKIYELEGPSYTVADIANVFSEVLNREVNVQQIERGQWESMLKQAGFSLNAAKNFIEMTDAVLDGRSMSEGKGTVTIKAATTFRKYALKTLNAER